MRVCVHLCAADEQMQCGECKKSFRNQTLLDYHNKYYHHVAVTGGRGSVARRRTSLSASLHSSSVERAPSSRLRSKHRSTCICPTVYYCLKFSLNWHMFLKISNFCLARRYLTRRMLICWFVNTIVKPEGCGCCSTNC